MADRNRFGSWGERLARWTVGVLLLSIVATAMTGTAAAQSAPDCSTVSYNGDGTEANPYEVGGVDQLQCIEEQGLDANYVQVSDINAGKTASWNGGDGFDPIGDTSNRFTGTFDGADYTISGLTIDRGSTDDVGLFGLVGSGSRLENAALENIDITGDTQVGGIVGLNGGTVENSYATGTVSGTRLCVGGLVGSNGGTVENSYATVDVSGTRSCVGGLVGGSGGTVTESYAIASVSGTDNVGGLVGSNSGTVRNSYATGTVFGDDTAGGLVGVNQGGGTVRESYATGSVSGSNDTVGGLVGSNFGGSTITESYATGSVSGDDQVGGLVGLNEGGSTITESYATGTVSGNGFVGGLVGDNFGGTVVNSYATGDVSINDFIVGGLVGRNSPEEAVTESYWDTETTGQPTSDGGMGLTTSEMTGDAATSNMTGFDFTNTWVSVTNPDDYPILAWQQPTASFTLSTTTPGVGEAMTFDASGSSDRDGSIQTYAWDFDGDGNIDVTRTIPLVTHTYSNPGTFVVTLNVTDDDGVTGRTTQTISVGSGGGGGCPVDPVVCTYDPNGVINTGELQQAINDFIQQNISTGDLQAVINAFIQS